MENNEEKQSEVIARNPFVSRVKIDDNNCDVCGACVSACREGVLAVGNGRIDIVDGKYCTECEACVEACANRAISVFQ